MITKPFSEVRRLQSELKLIAASEYYGALWQGTEVINAFCPDSPDTRKVTENVVKKMAQVRKLSDSRDLYTKPFRFADSMQDNPTWASSWPTDGKEIESTGPFVSLLEEICQAVFTSSRNCKRYFQEPTFRDYHGRTTLDATGMAYALKPDGGLFEKDIADAATVEAQGDPLKARFYWRQFLNCIEIKNQDEELVQQAFTYGRAMLLSVESRWFALVITYNHKTTEARFTFWTRWAMYATTPYVLKEQSGFQGLVSAMARMLMWKDAEAAGYLRDRNNDGLWVEDLGLLKFAGNLSYRPCARGRASRVYLAKDLFETSDSSMDTGMAALNISPIPRRDSDSGGGKAGRSSSPPDYILRRSDRLAALESQRQRSGNERAQRDTSSIFKQFSRMTLQTGSQTGSPVNKATQAYDNILPSLSAAFTANLGDVGMVELHRVFRTLQDGPDNARSLVRDEYKLQWKRFEEERKGVVDHYVVKDSWVGANYSELEVFKDTHKGLEDGAFGVARLAAAVSKSAPVTTVPNVEPWNVLGNDAPGQTQEARTFQTLIYKTIGTSLDNTDGPKQLVKAILHAVIGHYNMLNKGWLHCDVSIGNIILVPQGEKRAPSDWLPGVTECIGFMIDGDLAVQWEDLNRTKASSKSGTPPFMSERLLRLATMSTQSKPAIHSFTDDLHGYVWVLLWVSLLVGVREHRDATSKEWLGLLNQDSLSLVYLNKMHIRNELSIGEEPSLVVPLTRLLCSMFDKLRAVENTLDSLLVELSNAEQESRQMVLKNKLHALRDTTYRDITQLLFREIEDGKLPELWSDIEYVAN